MVLTWGWALRINSCTLVSSLEVDMELKEEERVITSRRSPWVWGCPNSVTVFLCWVGLSLPPYHNTHPLHSHSHSPTSPPQHTYTHPYTHIHTHTWMWIRTYLFLGEYCQTYWDSKRKSGIHGTTIKDATIKKNSAVAYTLLYAACVLLLCHGHNGLAARASD